MNLVVDTADGTAEITFCYHGKPYRPELGDMDEIAVDLLSSYAAVTGAEEADGRHRVVFTVC